MTIGHMTTRSFTIAPLGEFSLAESALFGFGQRMRPAGVGAREPQFDGVMRLAFCLDGYRDQVGVELRHDEQGVHVVVHGPGELDAIQRQVARVLSLDRDARGFAEVGQRDPVIGMLQRAAVGLRPPLFYSPYEAAVWSVLSARRPGWQMARVRAQLSEAHGAMFELAATAAVSAAGRRELSRHRRRPAGPDARCGPGCARRPARRGTPASPRSAGGDG